MKTKGKKTSKKGNKKYNIKLRRIIAISCLILVLIVLIILILFSSLFNIKKIIVINNSKVSTEEIIQSSGLQIGNNMFKTLNSTIKNGIKTNAYIENVRISKKLNGEVIITVEERTPTFMLKMDEGFAYINNQGYIVEISNEVLQTPIILGYTTEDINPGNRLNRQDLENLEIVIQIFESAKSNNIDQIITEINISDNNNYILQIPSEGKSVQFGDSSNINVKILWIVDLIEREKGIEGEIVLNVPDIKKVYFREKV